jgi:hypothetical protein
MRRDHAKTPPKPDSDMVAKAMKSSARPGGGWDCGVEFGAGSESGAGGSVEGGIGGEEFIKNV